MPAAVCPAATDTDTVRATGGGRAASHAVRALSAPFTKDRSTMTRSRLLLAAVGLFALTATACGSADTAGSEADAAGAPPAAGACLAGDEDCQDTGGDMGAPPPGEEQPVSDGGADPDPGEATRVEPTDGLEDVHPVGWDAVEVDPADQSQVTVYWWSGVAPCNALSEVEVETSDDAVTLTVLEGSVPSDEEQACIELAQYKSSTVDLGEDLGPRSILDGAETEG